MIDDLTQCLRKDIQFYILVWGRKWVFNVNLCMNAEWNFFEETV